MFDLHCMVYNFSLYTPFVWHREILIVFFVLIAYCNLYKKVSG